MRSQLTVETQAGASLLDSLGSLVRLLTRRSFSVVKIKKFAKNNLFTVLVVEHFIEAPSMQLFYTGLCIMKNLLRGDAQETVQMIVEYEECCLNAFGGGGQTARKGFLDIVHDALTVAIRAGGSAGCPHSGRSDTHPRTKDCSVAPDS